MKLLNLIPFTRYEYYIVVVLLVGLLVLKELTPAAVIANHRNLYRWINIGITLLGTVFGIYMIQKVIGIIARILETL